MQIAIIGAGNVGRALAGSFTRAGHDVTVSATNPEHARETATETGATAAEAGTGMDRSGQGVAPPARGARLKRSASAPSSARSHSFNPRPSRKTPGPPMSEML